MYLVTFHRCRLNISFNKSIDCASLLFLPTTLTHTQSVRVAGGAVGVLVLLAGLCLLFCPGSSLHLHPPLSGVTLGQAGLITPSWVHWLKQKTSLKTLNCPDIQRRATHSFRVKHTKSGDESSPSSSFSSHSDVQMLREKKTSRCNVA